MRVRNPVYMHLQIEHVYTRMLKPPTNMTPGPFENIFKWIQSHLKLR